ncbi:MAG: hypothetical protein V3V11_00185 [Vicinamibacteria bacterium]
MPRPASIAFLAWLAGVGPLAGQTSESHFEIVAATHWHTDHTWSYSLYRDAFSGGVDFVAHDYPSW